MLSKGYLLRNRYLIGEKLGGGVSGSTYLAEDTSIENKLCAIKELDPKEKDPENYKIICERFEQEAEILKELSGYNEQIPKWYEDFPEDGKLYIVQEYIEGKTLKELIRKNKNGINQSKVKEILVDLLPVVAHIHENYIHRDIKPENIILRKGSDKPVLIDFGGVKIDYLTMVSNIENTHSDTILIFSDGYTAPEQEKGHPIPASDIFSLGRVAIYLLSAIPPKEIPKDQNDFSKILWRDCVKEILPEFADLIDKSIEHYPGQRYKNAGEMLDAFRHIVFPESNETIAKQLSAELASVSTRNPKAFSEKHQKCSSCNFYVTPESEFCPNCSQYNYLCLNSDEILLLDKSPKEYFELKILPEMSPDDRYLLETQPREYFTSKILPKISEDNRFLLNKKPEEYVAVTHQNMRKQGKLSLIYDKRKIEAIMIIPLGIFWGIVSLYAVPVILDFLKFDLSSKTMLILTAAATLVLLGFTLMYFDEWVDRTYRYNQIAKTDWKQRSIKFEIEKKTAEIEKRKKTLEAEIENKTSEITERQTELKNRMAQLSENRRESYPPLLSKEDLIDNRIKELSVWTDELRKSLAKITSGISYDSSVQKLQNDLDDKYKICDQLLKQYFCKKLEIDLLRLNNSLQKETRVNEMSYDSRRKVEEKLEEIIELCNKIINYLKDANVIETEGGRKELARIYYINEITSRLRQVLIKQEGHLVLTGKKISDESIPILEFVSDIQILNAHVDIDDFYEELEMLEGEFMKARAI